MTVVPPDGPIPCNLAVVGEAPASAEVAEGRSFVGPSGRVLWARAPGDLDLMNVIAQRPRSTCYVSNVCKVPMPDGDWWKLTVAERSQYEKSLLEELERVEPRLVLAFGRRAATALVPGFRTMPADHGKPVLGPTRKYLSMALWHPAAYLRGNSEALGAIATDLSKVETLLADGVVALMQPASAPPDPAWPEMIGFLLRDGPRKSARCVLCGANTGIEAYSGQELTWKLCRTHAITSAKWAEDNAEALWEHRAVAMREAEEARRERVNAKMRNELLMGKQQKKG